MDQRNSFGVLVAPNVLGCSMPLARPLAILFDEMMRNFELQRDREFSFQLYADHQRNSSAKKSWGI
jgi:hypothetical protein